MLGKSNNGEVPPTDRFSDFVWADLKFEFS